MSKRSVLLVAGCAIAAAGVAVYSLVRSHHPLISQNNTITYSTSTPDEQPPPDSYRWPGKPQEPKFISLPSIHASGFVQKAGIDQHSALAVPTNVHMAAWFAKSALPGQPGLSIIDGHVHGKVEAGIFKDLVKLKQNDQIIIELGNGSKQTFSVVKSVTVTPAEAPAILFSQEPDISSQLNLITCSGTFDKKMQQYTKRTIVITRLHQD